MTHEKPNGITEWHSNLHFVLKTFILDIFQISEKKQRNKNQELFDRHLT